MIYPYECNKCGNTFDVYKRISEIDNIETCPSCESECDSSCRRIAAGFFNGEKQEDAYYNPALGQVVKSTKHARQIAKQKGFIEIGTETPDTIHKYCDNIKIQREKNVWRDLDNANRIEINSRGY